MHAHFIKHTHFFILSLLFVTQICAHRFHPTSVDIGVSSRSCNNFHYESTVTLTLSICASLPVLDTPVTSVKTDDWDVCDLHLDFAVH